MTRVGVVGSRTFTDESLMREVLIELAQTLMASPVPHSLSYVSGGADGADKMAASLAAEAGYACIVHLPDKGRYGWPRAAFERNTLIVRDADVLLAFFGPGEPPIRGDRRFGSGTMDTVTKAIAKRIPVHLHFQRRADHG